MGWIILIAYIIWGLLTNMMFSLVKQSEEGSKSKKILKIIAWSLVGIGAFVLAIFILYAIGWIWYYVCGGFLLFDGDTFGFVDGLLWGIVSLILLGFIVGFIAICCGWDPFK